MTYISGIYKHIGPAIFAKGLHALSKLVTSPLVDDHEFMITREVITLAIDFALYTEWDDCVAIVKDIESRIGQPGKTEYDVSDLRATVVIGTLPEYIPGDLLAKWRDINGTPGIDY